MAGARGMVCLRLSDHLHPRKDGVGVQWGPQGGPKLRPAPCGSWTAPGVGTGVWDAVQTCLEVPATDYVLFPLKAGH